MDAFGAGVLPAGLLLPMVAVELLDDAGGFAAGFAGGIVCNFACCFAGVVLGGVVGAIVPKAFGGVTGAAWPKVAALTVFGG